MDDCAREVALAISRKRFFVARYPISAFAAEFCKADQLVNRKPLCPPVDGDIVDFPDDEHVPNEACRFRTDQNLRSILFAGTFEPACHVHGIADDGVVQPEFGTEIDGQPAATIE